MSHINNFNKDGFVLIQNQIILIKQSGHASYTPLTASNLTIDEIALGKSLTRHFCKNLI